MATVKVEDDKTFETEVGKKLVLAIEDAGIEILHRCGGNSRCTTCRVQVLSGELDEMGDLEKERLAREESLGPDIRLSCQVHVKGNLSIRVFSRTSDAGVAAGPRPLD